MSLRDFFFKLRLELYRKLPIKRNRIVFLSHLGKSYGCNPRYLCEYIAGKYPGKFDLTWVYDKVTSSTPQLPEGVRTVPYFSHEFLRIINTAGFVVSNTRISNAFYFKKRNGQTYIQTWHSSLRLKCIEADANLGAEYEDFAKRDSAKIDVIFSGGRLSSEIFKKSFWYHGDVIESGTPRIDWLKNLTDNDLEMIYRKSGLSSHTRYLLYAPTFRKGASTDAYISDFTEVLDALKDRFGNDWKVLYRLHPNLKGTVHIQASDNVIDMTDYDDIQELLAISDMLVTDYSSSMFDAAFCNKSCILYACDLSEYVASERKLYFDIGTLPFPLAKTETELVSVIKNFDQKSYDKSLSEFMQTIGSCENGSACRQISDYILARI